MQRLTLLLVISFSLLFSITGQAGTTVYNKGLSAYQQQDYKVAEKYWKRSAKRGDAASAYSLAMLYQQGKLGKVDLKKAKKWHTLAANSEVPEAQYNLGNLYFDEKNYEEAAEWYSRAAKNGQPQAQFELASLYEQGLGVSQSWESTETWYTQAAKQDLVAAQLKLATLYMQGKGLPLDNVKAFTWAKAAAELGEANGQYLLGYMYYAGKGTVKNTEVAISWLEDALASGQPKAQNILDTIAKETQISAR